MFSGILYRAHNGYDVKVASDEACIPADKHGESMTVQSQAEDCDLNVLMKRMRVTGQMPVSPRVPTYGDFTGISDYRSAIEAVRNADAAFMEYPAELRARFDNDPQLFLQFASDEANRPEMEKLGLLKAKVEPIIPEVRVVNMPAQSTAAPAAGAGAGSGG